ncbi:MAG: Hpt domain-containing protein [Pseudomonadales bacterium]|nr:Hpt domain-containing protein [Pseudomonadales bacterium]
MSDKRSYIALEWVSREIEDTLNQAADALESFVQNSDDVTQLRFCLTYIHQVAGSLKMIELYGAALLSEEIEKVLAAMQKEEISAARSPLCASELLKAIKMLVAYVNQVNDSGEDDAKQLLPSLNAVRALAPNQSHHAISEADIFNPNISYARTVEHQKPAIAADEFNELTRKLRQGFQKGLVGIVRSQNLDKNYNLLCKVCAALLKISRNTAAEPLWKIAFAITELLKQANQPAELESKKALALLDKEIKKLEQNGPTALAEQPDAVLLKTLLYSVATSVVSTPLVDELRDTYKLNEALAGAESVSKKPVQTQSHNRELTSSSREKLEEIKELFVECVAAQWDSNLIRPVPRLLGALHKSLEGSAFLQLQPYLAAAKSFIENELLNLHQAPEWQIIESYADVISSLDYYLECSHAESDKKLALILQGANESLIKLGYGTSSNVAMTSGENAAKNTADSEPEEDEVDEEILEIFTEEAAEVIENINDYLPTLATDIHNHEALTELRRAYHTLKGSGRMVKAFTMGDFAWSIERMMNRVLDGEAQVTENCLLILQEATAYIPNMLEAFANKIEIDRTIVDAIIAKADSEWRGETAELISTPAIAEDAADDLDSVVSEAEPEEDEIDEEILEIFTEEAAEVLENIHVNLPKLKQDPSDMEALAELRRAYHTLKGSGRMVRAFVMGDFAWSIERMMNKVMDGNAEMTINSIAILEEATAYVPSMLSAFENKSAVDRAAVNAIIAKADAEREGKVVPENNTDNDLSMEIEVLEEETVELASFDAEVVEPDAIELFEQEDDGDSEELAAIFAGEAEACIQEFVDYLERIDPGFEDVEVSADLQRTFHTLKGSAYMAGVTVMAETVSPIESLVRDLCNYQIKADAEILAVFMQAAELLQQQLSGLKSKTLKHTKVSLSFIEDANALHARRIEISSSDDDDGTGLTDKYSVLLNDALECLTNAAELLIKWRRDEIESAEKLELVSYISRLGATAATANYPEVASLSLALADYYERAALSIAPANEALFILADKASDELDDMFDMIAAHQTVEAADDVISLLQQAQFEGSVTEESQSPQERNAEAIVDADKLDVLIDTKLYQQELQQADEEILEIFIEEANELMDELDGYIHNWIDQPDELDKLPDIKRALHTLKGGARLAELSVLGDITHEYESVIEKAEYQSDYSGSFFQQLEQYQSQIQCLVDYSTTLEESVLKPLLNQVSIEVESPELANQISVSPIEDNVGGVVNVELEAIDLTALAKEYAVADEETLEIFAEEAQELVTALEASAMAWVEDHSRITETAELKRVLHTLKGGARLAELPSLGDLTHNYESMIEAAELAAEFDVNFFTKLKAYLDQVVQMVDCVLELENAGSTNAVQELSLEPLVDSVIEVQKPVEPMVMAQLVSEVSEENEIDEVMQLFLEEAIEQNEGIDEFIAALNKDKNNFKPLDGIKRLLHTLKGGARLAEQMDIGDLSHDFETFIINTERDNKLGDENFVDELQAFHEQLNQKLEVLQKTTVKPVEESVAQDNVVPIRADIDVEQTSSNISQAAIDATKNFIESFNHRQQQKRSTQEPVKVAPDLLDNLINLAGENSIGRARVEEQVNELAYSVDEMDVTVDRLHGQLRRLEIETEAQIVFRQEQVENEGLENFDPLEMDRYSQMQQLSKSLIESASDLDDISTTFTNKMRDMETLLVQQGRINSELQEGLMRCQMVPFSRMVPRLRRIIRQIASELGKKVEFNVENAEGELDRTILERMIAPLEHMLRNAVDHGIEMPDVRKQAGKDEKGKITLVLSRDGGEVVLTLKDNGAGVNIAAVTEKAIERGLIDADAQLSDHELCQFILHAGFSTAAKVTQISGRGVGMDVVHSEIKQMGGTLEINSEQGNGSEFIVRLPFTVSVNRALMVTLGNDTYALPLNTIEGIVRVSPYELEAYYQPDAPMFEYAGQSYNLRYMGSLLHRGQQAKLDGLTMPLPVILIRSSEYTVAVQVDKLLGSQEVVVKTLGPQFSMVEGLNGATVLGDGSVVIILDMLALIRADASRIIDAQDIIDAEALDVEVEATRVMVVDDSVTVRKVTSRLLERYGLDVILAKDGLDAVTQLQEMENLPDVMLLDIEMPRMDGFEVVSRIRHNDKLEHIPICMITSRTGDKHRDRAFSLGANEYLGKPFQERELLQTISRLTGVEVIQS